MTLHMSCYKIRCFTEPVRKRAVRRRPNVGLSAEAYYAGAKFSESPPPAAIPKPPVYWIIPPETLVKLIAE